MAIQPIQSNALPGLRPLGRLRNTPNSGEAQPTARSFEDLLASLNQSQLKTDQLVQQLAQGENVDLHTVMIGLEENSVNFNVALGIRDRLVEAYREIMRMQV